MVLCIHVEEPKIKRTYKGRFKVKTEESDYIETVRFSQINDGDLIWSCTCPAYHIGIWYCHERCKHIYECKDKLEEIEQDGSLSTHRSL